MSFPQDPDRGRRPKQINAVLGLYDSPPHRDWLVWWTVGWTVIAGLAVAFPTEGSASSTSLPRWVDALLAAVVFGVLFGIFPAYLRLLVRRWRYRKGRRRTAEPTGWSVQTGPVQPMPPATPQFAPFVQAPNSPPAQAPTAPRPNPRGDRPPETSPPQASSRAQAVAGFERETPAKPPTSSIQRTGSGTERSARPAKSGPSGSSKIPADPSPIDALDLSAVRSSVVLSQARSGMPYPVARAVRAIQGATTMRDVYEGLLRGAEALSVVLGVVTVTWAREHDATTPQLDGLGQAMIAGGVSQGHWIQAFASVDRAMSQHPQPVVGLTEALKRGKGGSGLVADLNELVQERNRWAHGASPRNELEASERLRVVLPVFERAVEKARFLAENPWILTNDSRYRRREGDFLVHASRAMGDHPDLEHTTFVTPQPLAEDVFYLRASNDFIDMTPLVVMRQCPTCHQREVAYSDRLDGREGVSLKTFDRGHVLFDRGLVDEVHALANGLATGRASDSA